MSALYLTLLAVLVTGLGARDQMAIANLTARQGPRPMVLAIAIVLSLVTAAIMAVAAQYIVVQLMPRAREVLGAIALVLTGGELMLIAPRRRPAREPTRSLFAIGAVLAFHQFTDAPRFLIFAIAVATNAPVPAGIGGALGGVVMVSAAWLYPGPLASPRVRLARVLLGALFVVVGVVMGAQAMGWI